MISCQFEDGGSATLRHVTVHALVERDGKLLLVKRAPHLSEGGKWSLPSGFLDRDETASEGVLRELREETGWEGRVTSVFFIKTDPNRPHEDRQNIAFHFIVEPIAKVGEGDRESTAVSWVPVGELPPLADLAYDHGEAVELFLKYKATPFTIPLFV